MKSLLAVTNDEIELGNKAIVDILVSLRDDGIGMYLPNGLVIKEKDGTPSSVMRISIPMALRIAIDAINDSRNDHETQNHSKTAG